MKLLKVLRSTTQFKTDLILIHFFERIILVKPYVFSPTQVWWGILEQFSTKPLFYSNVSPLIFLCGIFIVSNQRFVVVYHGLSLTAVQGGLRIQG